MTWSVAAWQLNRSFAPRRAGWITITLRRVTPMPSQPVHQPTSTTRNWLLLPLLMVVLSSRLPDSRLRRRHRTAGD